MTQPNHPDQGGRSTNQCLFIESFATEAAKERAKVLFTPLTTVVGVGIHRIDGGFGVKVNLSEPAPSGADLPQTIDGVPVCVEVVGTIKKR